MLRFLRRLLGRDAASRRAPAPIIPAARLEQLTSICDAYWAGGAAAPAVPCRPSYEDYAAAVNELSQGGAEVLPWAMAQLDHADYDAREQAAFLIGELAERRLVRELQLTQAITKLSALATRPWVEDPKETQANGAAIGALGKIGDPRGVPALREVVTSPAWTNDDNAWDAAIELGRLVGEPFGEAEDPREAARRWLARQK